MRAPYFSIASSAYWEQVGIYRQQGGRGNVRELQNVLERAMNLAWFETLEWKYFSDYFKHHAYETKTLNSAAPPRLLRQRTDELEKDILMQVLQEFHGNKTLVAQNLGISRTILYKKLHKYQLL